MKQGRVQARSQTTPIGGGGHFSGGGQQLLVSVLNTTNHCNRGRHHHFDSGDTKHFSFVCTQLVIFWVYIFVFGVSQIYFVM